jgi:hypothetical protein
LARNGWILAPDRRARVQQFEQDSAARQKAKTAVSKDQTANDWNLVIHAASYQIN